MSSRPLQWVHDGKSMEDWSFLVAKIKRTAMVTRLKMTMVARIDMVMVTRMKTTMLTRCSVSTAHPYTWRSTRLPGPVTSASAASEGHDPLLV